MAKGQVARISKFTSPDIDLDAAVEAFLSYSRAKNLSQNTVIYYRYRLNSFKSYLESQAAASSPADLEPQQIREFISYESEHISPSTANHSITTLRAFFNYLVKDGFIERSPMLQVEKVRKRRTIVETFSTKQVEAVLGACGKDFTGIRDRALLLVLFDCGLRASEAGTLTIGGVCWSDQTMVVLGKGDKERLVPFGQVTRQALVQYMARRGELETDAMFVTCYGEPMDRYRVAEIVKGRCKKANIAGVRCSPHTFRHTFAVNYLRAGGDVFSLQKILGHSDLAMTRRYAELSQTDVQEKHRMFSPADRLQTSVIRTGRTRMK